jgi:hypothetical protein
MIRTPKVPTKQSLIELVESTSVTGSECLLLGRNASRLRAQSGIAGLNRRANPNHSSVLFWTGIVPILSLAGFLAIMRPRKKKNLLLR